MNQRTNFKALCPNCDKEMVCDVKAREKNDVRYEESSVFTELFILQCRGCHINFLFEIYYPSHDVYGDREPIVFTHPEPDSSKYRHHKPKKNIYIYNKGDQERCAQATKLYEEICTAINREQNIIAAMGMRTLINLCCLISTGSHDWDPGFTANLNSLEKTGYLATKSKNLFQNILEFGGAATHRDAIPRTKHLVISINAIESLIESLFVFPDDSAELARSYPARNTKKNKTP